MRKSEKPIPKTDRQKHVAKGIAYLTRYMQTYDQQYGHLDYPDETIINDVLYGLGVALDEKEYKYGDGFEKFKERLREHLARQR